MAKFADLLSVKELDVCKDLAWELLMESDKKRVHAREVAAARQDYCAHSRRSIFAECKQELGTRKRVRAHVMKCSNGSIVTVKRFAGSYNTVVCKTQMY